jgi:hypothetical protein
VVVIVVATSGGGGNNSSNLGTRTNAADTGTTGTTTTTALKRLAAFNLTPPVSSSKALGIAQVAEEGKTVGIVIIASGLPANTSHDAYGIWLYSGPTHQKFLGYYDDRVGSNGELKVTSILPTGASGYLSYSTLLITLENEGAKLTGPGTIELQGTVK